MALTTGKRTKITTASSIANRMGVVPAYAGDPISTIAQVATEKLDFFAKRQATIEETKYKAQVEIDTRKTISDFGKQYFDSPKDFTAAADKYIEKLVQEAPFRFKDYTKTLASRAAFSEGEKIFETRRVLDFDKAILLSKERIKALNERAVNETYNMPITSRNITPEGETVITNNFDIWKLGNDVDVGEIYKDIKDLYNSSYPEERRRLDSLGLNPDAWLRSTKVAIEGLRINNKIKNAVNDTLTTLREEKFDFNVGFDRIRQLQLEVTNMLRNEYMKDPVIDEKDGIAVLTGRTKEEAAEIVEGGIQFLNQELDLAKKEISIYNLNKSIELSKVHEENLNGFTKTPEKFTNYTDDQLTADIINLGLNDEQARIYKNTWTAGKIFNDHVDYYLPSGAGMGGRMKINAAADDLMNKLEYSSQGNLLSVLGVENRQDLKNLMIQQNLKKILNNDEIRDFNLGRINLFTYNQNGELMYDEKTGEPLANELWSKITAYAANMNEPIPQLTTYFDDVMNLTYTNEMDLNHLDQAAYMANYFKTRKGFEHQFKFLENKEIIIPLLNYHKLRQLNTSEVPRSTLAEDFFGKLNMEYTTKGQIKTEIDKFIYFGNHDEKEIEGNINITDVIDQYADKYEMVKGDVIHLYRDFKTGGYLIQDSKSREINKNELRQSIKPIIDVYLTAAFDNVGQVTEKTVRKKLDEIMVFLMEDISEEGFMWRNNKDFVYTTPLNQLYNWITK
jgi:hypothetical protein